MGRYTIDHDTVEIQLLFHRRSFEGAFLWRLFGVVIFAFLIIYASAKIRGGSPSKEDWIVLFFFLGVLYLGHLVLMYLDFRGNQLLYPLLAIFLSLGFLFQYRLNLISYQNLFCKTNIIFLISYFLWLISVFIFRKGRVEWLSGLCYPAYLISLGILLYVAICGENFRGARYAPGLSTPTEFLKFSLIIFLAGFINRYMEDFKQTFLGFPNIFKRPILIFSFLWLLPNLLMLLRRDLGNVIMFNMVLILLLFSSTRKSGYLIYGGIFTGITLFLIVRYFPYVQARFEIWNSPWEEYEGPGFQVIQSLFALNAGGFWGKGLGAGESRSIPLVSTDFIYSLIGEELGLAGSGLLLLSYILFLTIGFKIAFSAHSSFSQILGNGLMIVFALQIFLNFGGVIKLIPTTGLPLPYISRGGSSILTFFLIFGIIMALSEPQKHKIYCYQRSK